jgi:transcriptional regulator with XRE-family HTH domain
MIRSKEGNIMLIGKRLKKLRLDNDFTLEYVGGIAGISKQTLYKYENGIVTNIPSDKIEALARVYGVTPAFIMGWDESAKETPLTKKERELLDTYVRAKESDSPAVKALVAAIDKLLKADEPKNDE